MTKKQTNIHPRRKKQATISIQEEAIGRADSLITKIIIGPINIWGMYVMSSKVISEGRAYRKFMKRHYARDPEIGDMVKKLPHLWFMGIFRFDIAWIVCGIIIIWINVLYPCLRSDVKLYGRLGGMDATYFLLFIAWFGLYFVFKIHLSNKSQIFQNLLSEINDVLRSRENSKKKSEKY